MNFIKLTAQSASSFIDGTVMYIDPNAISLIHDGSGGSLIQVNNLIYEVKESASEVLDAITRSANTTTAIY